jgi:hypothetical protein
MHLPRSGIDPVITMQFQKAISRRLAEPFAIAAALLAAIVAVPCSRADTPVRLDIEARADGFAFRLVGAEGAAHWLLQHSGDGRAWEDFLYLEGGEVPGIEIRLGALEAPNAGRGFFRAIQLEKDDPLQRRFLAERARWRLSGFDSYQYELRQNFGSISWHGIVTVRGGEVIVFETIDLQPPVVEPPEVPTIDRLFERIAAAIASEAETIEATWHPDFGFPTSCFIDFSTLIADEEQGWTIDAFTPFR